MALEKYTHLHKDMFAFDGSGFMRPNTWYEEARKLIKYSEDSKLYSVAVNNPNSTDPIKATLDTDGNYQIGFGNHQYKAPGYMKYGDSEKTAKLYNLTSDRQVRKGDIIFNDTTGKAKTPIQQASLNADRAAKAIAIDLHNRIQQYHPSWLNTMHDHEFAALVDFAYNMAKGSKIVNDADFAKLQAYINNQQAAKAAVINKGPAAIAEAVKKFSTDAMMNAHWTIYCNPDNKSISQGLANRRMKDFKMYNAEDANYTSDLGNAKVDTVNGVTVTLSVNSDAFIDEQNRVANINAGTVMGTKIMDLIARGEWTPAKAFEVTKDDAMIKDATATKSQKKQIGGIINETSVPKETHNYSVITDARGFGGNLLPDRDPTGAHIERKSVFGDKDGGDFNNDRFFTNMNNAYGSFRKYQQTTDEDVSGTSTTWFFLTRPEMCLYQNHAGTHVASDKNWIMPSFQCRDLDLVDHLNMDRDLYIWLDSNIQPYYTDTNIGFIPAFTNNFKNTNLPETRFEMSKSSSNILGVSLGIPVYNSTDTADTEIQVVFNADMRKSVMKYIDLIFKYSKSKKEGMTIPWSNVSKYNVIDISMTMFIFVVGQDGVTLDSWYRSVGVVPSTNPVTSVPMTSAGERMDQISVSFKCNTNLDSRKLSTIEHFNILNRMGCSKITEVKVPGMGVKSFSELSPEIVSYDGAIDWFLMNRNIVEIMIDEYMLPDDWHTERFVVYIDPRSGRAEYKLTPIPKAARLWKLIYTLLNDNANTPGHLATMTGRAGLTDTLRFRPKVRSTYYQMPLNTEAIQNRLKVYNSMSGGIADVGILGGDNDAMVRMMSTMTTKVLRQIETPNTAAFKNYNQFIGTGVKMLHAPDANYQILSSNDNQSDIDRGSAGWLMNIFQQVDASLMERGLRPLLTTMFVDDEGNASITSNGKSGSSTVKGMESLANLLDKHTKNKYPKQNATFGAMYGGLVPISAYYSSAKDHLSNKSFFAENYSKLMDGAFDYIKVVADASKTNADRDYGRIYADGSFSGDLAEDLKQGANSTQVSVYGEWKGLMNFIPVSTKSPIVEKYAPNGIFIISDATLFKSRGDYASLFNATFTTTSTKDYDVLSVEAETKSSKYSIEAKYSDHRDRMNNAGPGIEVGSMFKGKDATETKTLETRKVDLARHAMSYGLDIHDSVLLNILAKAELNYAANDLDESNRVVQSLKMTDISQDALIREYYGYMNLNESEYAASRRAVMHKTNKGSVKQTSREKDVYAMSESLDKERQNAIDKLNFYRKTSPVDMVFETDYRIDDVDKGSDFRTGYHFKGKNTPTVILDGDKLVSYTTHSRIMYLKHGEKSTSENKSRIQNFTGDLVYANRDSMTLTDVKNPSNKLLMKTGTQHVPAEGDSKDLTEAHTESYKNYIMDTEYNIRTGGYEQYSLFDKTILVPTMPYERMRNFYLQNPQTGKARMYYNFKDSRYDYGRKVFIGMFDILTLNPVDHGANDNVVSYTSDGMQFPPSAATYLSKQQSLIIGEPTAASTSHNAGLSNRYGNGLVSRSSYTTVRSKTGSVAVDPAGTAVSEIGSDMTDSFFDKVIPNQYDGLDVFEDAELRKTYYQHFIDARLEPYPVPKKGVSTLLNQVTLGLTDTDAFRTAALNYAFNAAFDLSMKYVSKVFSDDMRYADGKRIPMKEVSVNPSDVTVAEVDEVVYDTTSEMYTLQAPVVSPSENVNEVYSVPVVKVNVEESYTMSAPRVDIIIDVEKTIAVDNPAVFVEDVGGAVVPSVTLSYDDEKIVSAPVFGDDTSDIHLFSVPVIQQTITDIYTSPVSDIKVYEDKNDTVPVEMYKDTSSDVSVREVPDVLYDNKTDLGVVEINTYVDKSTDEKTVAVSSIKNKIHDIKTVVVQDIKSGSDQDISIVSIDTINPYTEATEYTQTVDSVAVPKEEDLILASINVKLDYSKYDASLNTEYANNKNILEEVVKDISDDNFDFHALLNTVVKYK